MKVIAFNGSPRINGNTDILLKTVLNELQTQGIQTELVQLANTKLQGCTACGACFKLQNKKCVLTKDRLNEFIEKMVEADGILLGSPVYFADISTELKALIDRAGHVCKANNDLLQRKVGAAVIAVRRAGAIHAFDSINHFFLINQMIIPGSSYWNIGIGQEKGDVVHDEEGMQTMRTLGHNMGWLLKQLAKAPLE